MIMTFMQMKCAARAKVIFRLHSSMYIITRRKYHNPLSFHLFTASVEYYTYFHCERSDGSASVVSSKSEEKTLFACKQKCYEDTECDMFYYDPNLSSGIINCMRFKYGPYKKGSRHFAAKYCFISNAAKNQGKFSIVTYEYSATKI